MNVSDWLSLPASLEMIASGVGIAVAVSFLLKKVPWFQGLSAQVKYWLVFLAFVLVPVIAQAILLNVPPEVLAALAPYWRALVMGAWAWASSQFAHQWQEQQAVPTVEIHSTAVCKKQDVDAIVATLKHTAVARSQNITRAELDED